MVDPIKLTQLLYLKVIKPSEGLGLGWAGIKEPLCSGFQFRFRQYRQLFEEFVAFLTGYWLKITMWTDRLPITKFEYVLRRRDYRNTLVKHSSIDDVIEFLPYPIAFDDTSSCRFANDSSFEVCSWVLSDSENCCKQRFEVSVKRYSAFKGN